MYELFATPPDGVLTLALTLTEEGFSTLHGVQCFCFGANGGEMFPSFSVRSCSCCYKL